MCNFNRRGKLFTFGETMLDKGTGNKTWKERGVGDIRFLRLVFGFNFLNVLIFVTGTRKMVVSEF